MNGGLIEADSRHDVGPGDSFSFTAAPITNEGTLSAKNRATLNIANLAAPNAGAIAAAGGGTVKFTGNFAQAAAGRISVTIAGTGANQLGHIATAGAATLDGVFNVIFANGFTPSVGSRFQVLEYASRSGAFSSIQVTNLAPNLIVTPEYNATNMTLVVSAAQQGAGLISTSAALVQRGISAALVDAVLASGSPEYQSETGRPGAGPSQNSPLMPFIGATRITRRPPVQSGRRLAGWNFGI